MQGENTPEPIDPAPANANEAAPRRRLRRRKQHFARPDLGREEIQAVTRVLKSGWLTSGPETAAFEEEFAQIVGAKHAIAVNSCTAALHLALAGREIGPRDAVLVPALTFTATAEAVEYGGALPLVLDVDRESYLMDARILEDFAARECRETNGALIHQASGRRIRAMIPVHIGGRPCDLDALQDFANRYDLMILEDAAHAFPAEYRGRRIGSVGDATAFSFYATKNLTTGEGGMLTTDDDALAERARRMRLHGILGQTYGRKRWAYDVVDPGFKYNMNDLAAAMGRVQLARTEEMHARRRSILERYSEGLEDLPGLRLNPEVPGEEQGLAQSACHLFTLEILPEAGLTRDRFVEEMYARNIAVSLHFIPLYRLTRYRRSYRLRRQDFPNCEAIYANIVSLPLYSAMTPDDAEDVIFAVRETLAVARESEAGNP